MLAIYMYQTIISITRCRCGLPECIQYMYLCHLKFLDSSSLYLLFFSWNNVNRTTSVT